MAVAVVFAPRIMPARRSALLALALASLAASGCGEAEHDVVVTLAVTGAAKAEVNGLDVKLALPAGARVAHDRFTGRIPPASLALRGRAALGGAVEGKFNPDRAAPYVRLLLASSTALADGDAIALTVTLPGRGRPWFSDFEVAGFLASGPGGEPRGGVNVAVAGVADR